MAQCSMCKQPEACRNGCMAEASKKYSGGGHQTKPIHVRSMKRNAKVISVPNSEFLRKIRI